MSEQRHLIKRQLIELTVPEKATAWQLQTEVSRIYRQRLVPLIDQVCSALSEPDRLYRIERLELDLGSVDPQNLEAELVARMDLALRQALAEQIDAQQRGSSPGPQVTSQLELLALFARTGSLPWWADVAQPHLLAHCLQHLIHAAPVLLRRLLQELLREPRSRQRLVQQYSDDELAVLATLLAPALKHVRTQDVQALIAVLQSIPAGVGRVDIQLRQLIWHNIFMLAGWVDEQQAVPEVFYKALLTRVAAELAVPYPALLTSMHAQLAAGAERSHREFRQTLTTLHQQRVRLDAAASVQLPAPAQVAAELLNDLLPILRQFAPELPALLQNDWLTAVDALEHTLITQSPSLSVVYQRIFDLLKAGLTEHGGARPTLDERAAAEDVLQQRRVGDLLIELEAALRTLMPYLPSARQGEGLTAHSEWEPGLTTPLLLPIPIRQRILALLQHGLADQRFDPMIAPNVEAAPSDFYRSDRAYGVAAVLKPPSTVDLSFSTGDELYIGNAGLVILWPFLGHFFARLGLLAEQQFKDPAAMQRAVGLLQHLAMGEHTFPEYLLPLNKLLCGMQLTEVFDFGLPLTDNEAEEGTDLLRAVIAQAPILRDMSTRGLQGTFLLRQGVLRTRDGAWLLQVERETYDIVLERFPWQWSWVKLPWMDAPLRVEW